MDTAELQRRWREKNSRLAKAIPVEIADVGTIYVRPMKVSDADFLQRITKANGETYGVIIAGLMCDESGGRLPPADFDVWQEILADATWADFMSVKAASTGMMVKSDDDKAADSGN